MDPCLDQNMDPTSERQNLGSFFQLDVNRLKLEIFSCIVSVFSEAESQEKHGVWDPMPELTITSPYVHSRVDSNTFTMGNPIPESTLTLC